MRVLFIVDPLDTLNLATETSLLLIEELGRRGHASYVATVPDLCLSEIGASVRAWPIELNLERRPFYQLGAPLDGGFGGFNLVLMRKDPPVDEAYIFATQVLEVAAAEVAVVNDPRSLRLLNEKLLPLRFPQWTPPTLVSSDAQRLIAFAVEHGRVVLKPLAECSGRGIRIVDAAAAPQTIGAALAERHGGPLLAQRFLPGVEHGDKRVLLLAGEPIGAVNRIPRSPAHLANIHQGARVTATEITAHEHTVIAAVRPLLDHYGLWLTGLDFIDGHLTEINITSPSAVRQINAVSGSQLEIPIVDLLERLATNRRSDERGAAID
jgi:glutathione synthase